MKTRGMGALGKKLNEICPAVKNTCNDLTFEAEPPHIYIPLRGTAGQQSCFAFKR